MYGIIGKSSCMLKLFKMIERVASANSTILIQGESGTGKELIARAVHNLSPRKDQPLVPVNCGAIPEDLLESELFGHVRGAFTGAANTRVGRFELANGGTLFLDEIGDMSPKLQVKMLRVLQEKIVEPVGAVKPVRVDVRVIAATHKDLEKEVAEKRFREDLFYRLNVVPIHVPALRERHGDIPLLVNHFLERSIKLHERPRVNVEREIMEIFQHYPWPGNVRELENLIERLTILSDGSVQYDDLPPKIRSSVPAGAEARGREADKEFPFQERPILTPAPLPETDADADRDGESDGDGETDGGLEAVSRMIAASTQDLSQKILQGLDFNGAVASFENQLILSALDSTGWNKNKAARLLNLNRTTLVEKIKKKGLERLEKADHAEMAERMEE
ncbi:Anaerobic nitric oxide reductase transcription regulator NorR [Candidatus Magnetaquicoccaceae bacterium FCR-1]|uniref:Anaerobic nitric oxide reductase transcription regulator NorR n=1 Tax=Candidatus Magnetaquiglobus chichijimensis TaxID=3141448 RepID=A0ABQ0CD09_9PROT